MLGRWVKEHQTGDDQAFRGNGKLTPEQEEIKKLKVQVKRLEMEKEILKKATVGSTCHRNALSIISCGVLNFNAFRGRSFSSVATASNVC